MDLSVLYHPIRNGRRSANYVGKQMVALATATTEEYAWVVAELAHGVPFHSDSTTRSLGST
jgi:hypothetical protein